MAPASWLIWGLSLGLLCVLMARDFWHPRVGRMSAALSACDRHASRLAGASPAMALGRREHVDKGKGARRNFPCTLRMRRMAMQLPDGSQ